MASFSNSPAVLAFGATALISVLPTIILPFIPLDKGSINSSLHRVMLAFAAGGMLGDVFLHLLPHVMGGHHHHDHNEEGHASVLRQLEAEHAQRSASAHHHHHTHTHGAHARREATAHSHEHSHGHSHSHSHQEQEGGGHDSHDHSHHHTHPGEAAAAAAAAAPPPSHDHHVHHHSHSGGGGGGGHGGHGGGHGLADLRVGLAVLAGVLVFFLADKWLRAWHGGDGHSHAHGHAHTRAAAAAAAEEEEEEEEEEEKAGGPGGGRALAAAAAAGPSNGGGGGTGLRRRRGQAGAGRAGGAADVLQEQKGNDADDKHKKMKSSGVLSKLGSGGWLNLGADALHNATDGLALGAAFAAAANNGAGAGLGVSTLIATLAHELPHEIGDYAVLVQNGLTKKQAILAQFCTAIGAFMGTAAGLVLHSFEDLQPALLAFTAGGFVYVSCVTVLPEVLNNSGHHHGGGKGDGGVNLKMITQTIAETLGMLIGIGLMVVVALYE